MQKFIGRILTEIVASPFYTRGKSSIYLFWIIPKQINKGTVFLILWNILKSINKTNLVNGPCILANPSMNGKYIVICYGSKRQVIKSIHHSFPYSFISIYAFSFIRKAINARHVTGFLITS